MEEMKIRARVSADLIFLMQYIVNDRGFVNCN